MSKIGAWMSSSWQYIAMAAVIVALFLMYKGERRERMIFEARAKNLANQRDRAIAAKLHADARTEKLKISSDEKIAQLELNQEVLDKKLASINTKERRNVKAIKSKGTGSWWKGKLDDKGGIKGFDLGDDDE